MFLLFLCFWSETGAGLVTRVRIFEGWRNKKDSYSLFFWPPPRRRFSVVARVGAHIVRAQPLHLRERLRHHLVIAKFKAGIAEDRAQLAFGGIKRNQLQRVLTRRREIMIGQLGAGPAR